VSPVYRVCLLGCSDFERNALVASFRLAAHRVPRYAPERVLASADFVVADADHGPSVQLVLATERLAETIFIGLHAPAGARACVGRPIDPLVLLRELDALVAERPEAPIAFAAEVRGRVAGDGRRARPTHGEGGVGARAPAEPAVPPAASAAPVPPPMLEPAPPRPPVRSRTLRRAAPARPGPVPRASTVLVVDDSEIARRFLQSKLERFGLDIDLAATSGDALAMMARRTYDLVFLDMELGEGSELDGLALCQRIKRGQASAAPLATVVMVTAHDGELDRVRAALAGCDGFLGKPLDDAELGRLLGRHGLALRADRAAG
jgi:CheY-like chemotaxis protein